MVRRGCIVVLALAGCLAQRVDEAPDGTFVCAVPDDCEAGEHCVLGVCEASEGPRLEIRHPEAFDRIDMPADPSQPIAIAVSVGGERLDLNEPHHGGDEVGAGYVELLVDDELVARLTSGNLVAGVAAQVAIPAEPGAHRITAIARTPTGARYDNIEATGTQLVWVDDHRPHVAFVEPWPHKSYSLQETGMEVALAAINYTFVPFDVQIDGYAGHAHVHYDDAFPACVDDADCDCCYIAVVAPKSTPAPGDAPTPVEAWIALPAADAGQSTLSVVLRDSFHAPIIVDGQPVWDTVAIERVDIAPLPTDEDPYDH